MIEHAWIGAQFDVRQRVSRREVLHRVSRAVDLFRTSTDRFHLELITIVFNLNFQSFEIL